MTKRLVAFGVKRPERGTREISYDGSLPERAVAAGLPAWHPEQAPISIPSPEDADFVRKQRIEQQLANW